MEIRPRYETTDGPSELVEGETYYDSWDAELFTVLCLVGSRVRVLYHFNGETDTVPSETLEVDFERIHPVEATWW